MCAIDKMVKLPSFIDETYWRLHSIFYGYRDCVFNYIKTLNDVANPIYERVWVTPIHILNCPIGGSNKFAMKFAAFVKGGI